MKMNLPTGKKIYFTSDHHFGAPTSEASREREMMFVQWLEMVKTDAEAIFILGDLFDFWYEYTKVVPKGFVRVLGKLAELRDQNIKIYFFVGNHDLWMKDYFMKELNIPVYYDNREYTINNKNFLVGHGDGKGPGDKGYKRMKILFTNRFAKWLFKWIHPDWGVSLAQYLSLKNKIISGKEDVNFLGEDKEWLILYAKHKLQQKHYDYFVFGHRHLPMILSIQENSDYINLGDWINYYSYGVYDGNTFGLQYFKK